MEVETKEHSPRGILEDCCTLCQLLLQHACLLATRHASRRAGESQKGGRQSRKVSTCCVLLWRMKGVGLQRRVPYFWANACHRTKPCSLPCRTPLHARTHQVLRSMLPYANIVCTVVLWYDRRQARGRTLASVRGHRGARDAGVYTYQPCHAT